MPWEPWDEAQARHQAALAEERLSGLDGLPDGLAAARAAETVETLVGLYGQCLGRITAHLAEHPDLLARLAADELVGHLLLVHDLHPDPVETRVTEALAALPDPPEVLELSGTALRVRVRGGCGSAGAEQAVRDAVAARAPEIEDVTVESGGAAAEALIPVDALFRAPTPVGQGASCGGACG
ncbi:nitrogen fixation protein NifU [Streptomyces sporangiiformans]|uniref:Nitrogen fixation protein NifU n=1 Tax=Streptomyces sporangiiformans TaxID=2315329 RepID=A0A505DGG0_9ACTN|nr:nitrogen fixation protein NifU [Streptomyces sporangiiformans]TPQ17059.1 nitrogen fixation protein NifU [Streptomyces sporangiiformans]